FLSLYTPPPSSPLFPYTTLFRSENRRRPRAASPPSAGPSRTARGYKGPARPNRVVNRSVVAPGGALGVEQRATEPRGSASSTTPDRKSTRLNSSHVAISYAVFCL